MSRPRESLDDADEPQESYRFAGYKMRGELDYDLIEHICVAVADEGAPFTELMNKLGIDPCTVREWKRRGDIYCQTESPPEWEKYGDFVVALRMATGHYYVDLNKKVQNPEDGDHFLKIAERRLRDIYGRDAQGESAQVFNPDDQFL